MLLCVTRVNHVDFLRLSFSFIAVCGIVFALGRRQIISLVHRVLGLKHLGGPLVQLFFFVQGTRFKHHRPTLGSRKIIAAEHGLGLFVQTALLILNGWRISR